MNIAIVEDDQNTQDELKQHLLHFCKEHKLSFDIECFSDAQSFLNRPASLFSLVFLDIDLPGISGMKAAVKLREQKNDIMIIFVTSLAQYALKGYKVQAFDFIVKPFNYYSLEMSLNRALPTLKTKGKTLVIAQTDRTKKLINIEDLIYIEVINHTLYFHSTKGTYSSIDTLDRYHKELSADNFALCNRCYLVNLHFVTGIKANEVILSNGHKLTVSRYKKQTFIDSLNLYLSQEDAF